MKGDIRFSPEDDFEETTPERPPFLVKKEAKKKPRPKKLKRKSRPLETEKKSPVRKPKAKKSSQRDSQEEQITEAQKRYRRERLKAQERMNRRGDLVFLWFLISLVTIGSVLVTGYYYLIKKQGQSQPQEAAPETSPTTPEPIAGQSDYFLFLSTNEDRGAIYQDFYGTQEKKTIVSYTPPAEVNDSDADWNQDHLYAFIDTKGVEVYNSKNNTKNLLAPNRGDREYFKVRFAQDGRIITLYRKNEKTILEIYSSALKKIKSFPATDFNWTAPNLSSYILINKKEDQYQFWLYSQKKKRFLEYFSPYFGTGRYPISYSFSPDKKSVAFLVRDGQGSKEKIILSIGDLARKELSKVSELLYLESGVEDSQLINPTIVWDRKEDFIFASINNRIFKIDLTSDEAEELILGFNGTAQHLSPDRKYLYIRKADQSNTINQPESVVIYDLGDKKVIYSSPLSQVVKFIGYRYFKEK